MKILYHHRTASKDGQAVHIEEMIDALRAQGHEVRMVAPQISEAGAGMGAKVGWAHRLKAALPQAAYELLELGYNVVAYRALARAAREFEPDVLYERHNLYLVAGALLKRRFKLPMLLEVNSPLADEREKFGGLALPRLARWSERLAWRSADRVLPVTQVLAGIVQAQSGLGAEHFVVIPNGINEAHFAHAPPPAAAKAAQGLADKLVLGFTGFVRDWHGVDRVIRWMATPAAPANAVLFVVGDGPARAELQAQAEQLGLTARVRFTGIVPREQVPALVAAFDIALQPAVTPYASPLKLFEYLALGKAIVAPRVPNIMEVLRHDANALLFDADDEAGFARTLTQLAGDTALRERLAAAARATIQQMNLTWAGNAQRVVALAHAVRGTAPAPPRVEAAAASEALNRAEVP